MNLVGRFFFRCTRKYHQTGEVVKEATPGVMFVRFDRFEEEGRTPDPTMVMVKIDDMVTEPNSKGDIDPDWHFFDTRAELDGFMRLWEDVGAEIEEDVAAAKKSSARKKTGLRVVN